MTGPSRASSARQRVLTKKVLIASDHAGTELKAAIQKAMPEWHWLDLGPSTHDRVDYPDYAVELCRKLTSGEATSGILICGSGIGMSITANKVSGIRAAVVENPVSARLAREHNDANVLCLGSRFTAAEYGAEIARIFLETPFSGDARHQARIDKIRQVESKKV
jgi:ribose 5-phosphate isomerase B